MQSILVLINGWRNRTIRGGDYHVLRVLKNCIHQYRISLIMPTLGYQPTKGMLHNWDHTYFSSKNDKEIRSVLSLVFSYLFRTIKSVSFNNINDHEIIIASSHLFYDIIPAVLLRKRSKSKLVVYVFHIFHSFRSYREGLWSSLSLLSEKMSLYLCRKADLIFVDNDSIKDSLICRGFESDRIFVTQNGVEHEFIDSVKMASKQFDGCFCGSLDKRKGIYDLLFVWQIVLKHFPNSKLVIIGQGPEYGRLLRIIRKKGLERNILLTGYLSEEQKISTMKSSKLFIFPSYEEGWGIAVTEAMACGLAVLCYDLDAYRPFGNGVVRIQVGKKEILAKSVDDLLSDENKQYDASLKAKEASKTLNWENIAENELIQINKLFVVSK